MLRFIIRSSIAVMLAANGVACGGATPIAQPEIAPVSRAPGAGPLPPVRTSNADRPAQAPGDHRVTAEELLEFAERHAPATVTARHRLRLGDAEVEAASPLLAENPEVGGSIGYRTTDEGSGVDFEVEASQAIPLSGARAARVRAAQAARRAMAADLESVRWRVRQQIRREYRDFTTRLDMPDQHFVPISALMGDVEDPDSEPGR